jgi:2-methylisocitrate lyase-like PEP mutase family enzyme
MSVGGDLRARLAAGMVVAPLVYDGLTALIARRAGFDACAISVDGVAAQRGVDPDLLELAEVTDVVRHVADAVSFPVIVEAPRGVRDARHVARCAAEIESAGAAGLHVDTSADGLRAALDARIDPAFVVIARTRLHDHDDWSRVLARVHALRAAGADLVYVDGLDGGTVLDYCARHVAQHGPTACGGSMSTTLTSALGFALHFAGAGHALSIAAVRDALARVRRGDETDRRDQLKFDEITSLLGLDDVYDLEARYATDPTKGR